MAESSLSFVRGSTPMADGDPELAAIVESPRHVDAATVDGEKPKGGERTHLDSKARGQVRKAGPPSSTRSGCKDGLEDDGSIQTIRVSNAASSHWLAIEDDSTAAPSTPPAALYGRTSPQGVSLCGPLPEEQAGGSCKPYKPAGAGGQDGESLQGPHTWRKRLKSVSCLENGDVKREPRRELEHVQEKYGFTILPGLLK